MPGSSPPWLPGIASLSTYGAVVETAASTRGGPVDSDDVPRCSARGCTSAAAFALLWNNPKIHPPERRKTWLACAEHRSST